MTSIGIDIEEVSRFRKMLDRKPGLLRKMFSEYEWEYASNKHTAQCLTGLWCAKEAVVKALYAMEIKLMINQVYITHNKNGVPIVDKLISFDSYDVSRIKISISHTISYAVGICFIDQ